MTFQDQMQNLMGQAAKIKPTQKQRLQEAVEVGRRYQIALQAIAKLEGQAGDIARKVLDQ